MSRHDLDGFFWNDVEREARGKREVTRALPPFPETGWTPPKEFPNLRHAKLLAIDTEAKDPFLKEKGSGVRRGGAHMVGLAVGTQEGDRWYFPIRHEVQAELNMDPDHVIAWAKDNLCVPGQAKVGANLLYDLDMLAHEGVFVSGPFYDVQLAEPLLNENAFSYSLDTIAETHLSEGKKDEALYAWSERAYGGKSGRSQASNIYRCPPSLVGPYAEGDVDLPLRIFEKQKVMLGEQGLDSVFDIETRLVPLMLAMRKRGVLIDLPKAQYAYDDFTRRIDEAEQRLGKINVYAASDIKRFCDRSGIEYPRTEKGAPSFTKEWLTRHSNPSIRLISEIRRWYKVRDTFIKGYILESHANSRLHCQFNQLRSDDGGTVSGRFSSSNPNLQNIPVRDPELGPLMRSMFIPEDGEQWARNDWSQIEFRFLCHYGRGQGANDAREMYCSDPSTDFHQMAAELTQTDRKFAKNVNFGLVYGMGEAHMADTLGRPLSDVKPMFDTYHSRLPFIRATYNAANQVATQRGYIKTMLGRRRRFDEWVPSDWKLSRTSAALSREKAVIAYGARIQRAFTHKALNGLLQGSAADAMKIAMVQLWESGLCDDSALGAPLLTVHDELDWSIPPGREALMKDVKHILETCIKLRVPVIADTGIGKNWAECA